MCGLYAVLWGKGKEMKKITQLVPAKINGESSKSIEIVITSPVDGDITTKKEEKIEETIKVITKGDNILAKEEINTVEIKGFDWDSNTSTKENGSATGKTHSSSNF